MSVGCHGREYDGGREFVHVSVPGTILGTAREGLGSGWPVQRMSRTGVGSKILSRELTSTMDVTDRCRRYVARKINQSSAEYTEGVVCCLLSCSIPTMGTRAMLLGLIDTEMVSITIMIINRCRSSIGREPTKERRA
jgi:hypothetical protein